MNIEQLLAELIKIMHEMNGRVRDMGGDSCDSEWWKCKQDLDKLSDVIKGVKHD